MEICKRCKGTGNARGNRQRPVTLNGPRTGKCTSCKGRCVTGKSFAAASPETAKERARRGSALFAAFVTGTRLDLEHYEPNDFLSFEIE